MSFTPSELLAKSPLGIVISDQSERILWCNSRFLKETQLAEESVIGNLYPSLPIEAIDRDAQTVQLFTNTNSSNIKFQYWQESLDVPSGAKIHYFTQERSSRNKVTLAAIKITNAQLPKRASWVEFLDYEVSRSRRYDNPLSILKLHLLVLDKPEALAKKTLQQTIRDSLMGELRWADMIGHTDQGTYLVVLPETPASALAVLQKKLEKAIKQQIAFINNKICYHIVFGEACWKKRDDSRRLLKRARTNLVENIEAILAGINKN